MTKLWFRRSHLMVLQEGEPEIGLVRTISATARQELRNSEGLSDQMREKLDQLDQGTLVETPGIVVANPHTCAKLTARLMGPCSEGSDQRGPDSSGRMATRE